MKLKTFYGLPSKVVFCKKSLISNQRQISAIEFLHKKKTTKKTLNIDAKGISDSWKYSRIKKKINFKIREKKLLKTSLLRKKTWNLQMTKQSFCIAYLLTEAKK